DLLWQNDDGLTGIWEMNGTSLLATGTLGNPGASWHAIGAGDFNGDGKADILWQNADGTAGIWEMNGFSLLAARPLGNPGACRDPATRPQHPDAPRAIPARPVVPAPSAGTSGTPSASMQAFAAVAHNAGGKADVLWQNHDARAAIWDLTGDTRLAAGTLGNP